MSIIINGIQKGLYLERGEFNLNGSSETISLNNDGTTWTKIPNMTGIKLSGFTVSGGTLTKTGSSGTFLFNGVSDLRVNKACSIFYGLFVNGSVVPTEITEHTFTVLAKVENISITAIADLNPGDTIEVYAKGDGVTNDVDLTAIKLDITFWGE